MKIQDAYDHIERRTEQLADPDIQKLGGKAGSLIKKLRAAEKAIIEEPGFGLKVDYSSTCIHLGRFVPELTERDKEAVEALERGLMAWEDLGWTEEKRDQVCDALTDLNVALEEAQSTNGNSPSRKGLVLGAAIEVKCGCGWFQSHDQGDWSWIRTTTRDHATVCSTANPGRLDSLVNDLDRVRKLVMVQRKSTTSGGLLFEVEKEVAVAGS